MHFSYVPAYGFGKAKKNELTKTDQLITPGPGKYYPNPVKIIHKNPEWKIGTSQRPKESNLENPGPGTYNTRFKFPDGPSYSIRTRKKEGESRWRVKNIQCTAGATPANIRARFAPIA